MPVTKQKAILLTAATAGRPAEPNNAAGANGAALDELRDKADAIDALIQRDHAGGIHSAEAIAFARDLMPGLLEEEMAD